MLPGFNHNVRFNDRIYHVQTEDNGLKVASVVTQVFLAGQVLALEKISYQDVLEAGGEAKDRIAAIRLRMQEQHKTIIKRVAAGAFEEQVETLFSQSIDELEAAGTTVGPTPVPTALLDRTTDSIPPTFAEAADLVSEEKTTRIDDSDFLSSLDAEVRRHIEASDPSLPPFDSSIMPSEPPPIPPQPSRPTSRINSSMNNAPLRTRRLRPPPVPGSNPRRPASAEPSPPSPTADTPADPNDSSAPRPRFRRPLSSTTARPISQRPNVSQDELRRTSAELGLPMPGEPSQNDPNATMLELDAGALKARLEEQRQKLRRASERAAEQWALDSKPTVSEAPTDKVTVTERSLDEVLLSYLSDDDERSSR